MSQKILVVDNDPEMVALLGRHLEAEGWAVTGVTSGAEALAALEREEVPVVLTDLVMDEVDGLALLREAQRIQPGASVILMTAFGSLETAIEAMRQGAYDYLTKPFKLAEVSLAVRRAVDDQRLREENRRLRAEVERRYGFDNLLGQSKAMQAVFEQIRAVAGSEATVLLLGESGSGKELVARAIHWNSPRKGGPFVPVNCAAIPETLLESELFGHEKGAFTGADRKRRGLFVEADRGTLFLDEVGDMSPALQAKLLRALEDKAIRPVGGKEGIRLDLRLITATNRDLLALVQEGRFREDLYYRLAVIPIRLPSLRERSEDIPLLAEHFLKRAAGTLGKGVEGFNEEAMAWLLEHRWPGNVRELENVVERAVTLARDRLVTLADLRIEFTPVGASTGGLRPTLAELERQYIQRVLEETKGDKGAAAKILGVSVRTLQRKAKHL
ncbi:MAG: sigma-54-dependent Fis family transcriptional regulator [Candidatus Rokubacteria bacterium]|nr:sigma-54-dependent Fis family transcriptional regulator [Candidatus Rokubacteria bacterium]